jgi:hypothetical protein
VRTEPTFRGGLYKLFNGLTWTEKKLPSLTYSDLGYGKNKDGLLRKNYINEEELERVDSILKRRAGGRGHHMTSVALAFRGEKKHTRSQGWCLLSLVVSRMRRPAMETVEIHYRSTEAILKFGADLVLLNWVFERLNLNPDQVTFRFANIHLSGVYLPTLFQWWEPEDFIQFVHKHDRDFFKRGLRWLLRRFPFSPENVQHRINWERGDPPRIVKILDPLYQKYGYDLPKLHHNKSTYQVRRKRSVEDE